MIATYFIKIILQLGKRPQHKAQQLRSKGIPEPHSPRRPSPNKLDK